MIKREKIDQLAYEKVIKPLESYLLRHNYLYQKSSKIFVRAFGDYEHKISIGVPKYDAFDYINNSDELNLNFSISFSIAIPQFEFWFENRVNRKPNYLQTIETINGYINIDIIEDFGKLDFHTKPYSNDIVKYIESNLQNEKDSCEFESIIQDRLEKEIDNLISNSNIMILFELSKYPMHINSIGLLTYGGYDEKAVSLLDSRYKDELKYVTEKKLSNDNISYYAMNFQQFIKDALALKNIEYHNPFDSEIVCIQNTGTKLSFTDKSVYKEILRIPITEISIKHHFLNPNNGDFILYLDNDKVLKFNRKGEKLLEFKPENPKNYTSTWHFSIGHIEGTECFFVNNCIITQSNEIIYILKEKWNKKQLITKSISYSKEEDIYTIESKIIAGRVIPDIIVNTLTSDFKIIETKEHFNITDFFSNEIAKLKNGKVIQSHSKNYALWFGNGTKSILFDLKKKEKKTIFGHPTLVKDYIQTLYKEDSHNFDITNVVFANNDTYLVASALFGKIVAWKLPNLERVELIPKIETIEKLEYGELISVNNQPFFKWSNGTFGAYILEIHILQNSEIFISQTERLITIWNNKFENIGHIENSGRIKVYSDRFLTQHLANELKIYELTNE